MQKGIRMAINKFMRLALKALSYPDIDIQKTYQLQRSLQNFKAAGKVHQSKKFRNHIVTDGGREILTRIYTPNDNIGQHTLLFFTAGDGSRKISTHITTYVRPWQMQQAAQSFQ